MAAEGLFARFSRWDQGRARGVIEARGKEAKLNLAKFSDSKLTFDGNSPWFLEIYLASQWH
ncbi:MAG TPA: hypothetical protein VIH87_14420 [Methylocella sp.]